MSYKQPASGIILIKYFKEVPKVLGLFDQVSFDLPKGKVEGREDIFSAALRETEEECSITEIEFKWGLKHTTVENITLFIATTSEEPVIRPNPHTGRLEHQLAKWLSFNDISLFKEKLRPAILWASKIVGENNVSF